MNPTLGYLVDKSPEKETEFVKNKKRCKAIWSKINNRTEIEDISECLTEDESKFFDKNCVGGMESTWDIDVSHSTWFRDGGRDTVSASSELKSPQGLKFAAKNSNDLSYKSAWTEGVPGYGIGEYLVYHFPYQNPIITKIIIVNGFVRSEQNWSDNSRVKKLKMYIEDKPFAILNLADSRQEQTFTFDFIFRTGTNSSNASLLPWWTIKFEILDVYKGRKYDDTSITEIYFDGIDLR